jgi:hypothetical protein
MGRFGIASGNLHRLARDASWSMSIFQVEAAIDTRQLWPEMRGMLKMGDSAPYERISINIRRNFFTISNILINYTNKYKVKFTRKIPSSFRKLSKKISKKYLFEVTFIELLQCYGPVGSFKFYCFEREASSGGLLLLVVHGGASSQLSYGDEIVRCSQGTLWRLPTCGEFEIRSYGPTAFAFLGVK